MNTKFGTKFVQVEVDPMIQMSLYSSYLDYVRSEALSHLTNPDCKISCTENMFVCFFEKRDAELFRDKLVLHIEDEHAYANITAKNSNKIATSIQLGTDQMIAFARSQYGNTAPKFIHRSVTILTDEASVRGIGHGTTFICDLDGISPSLHSHAKSLFENQFALTCRFEECVMYVISKKNGKNPFTSMIIRASNQLNMPLPYLIYC